MFDRASSSTMVIASLAAGVAITFAAFHLFNRKRKFRCVGRVESLFIFPVKSLKGVQVDEAECTPLGLRSQGFTDRCWALSTASGQFMSQRKEPRMALIQPTWKGKQMTLHAPGMDPITFDAFPQPDGDNLSTITIWQRDHPSVDCGDEVSKWLSSFFKKEGIRMHFSAPSLEKTDLSTIKNAKFRFPAKPGDVIGYGDDASFMILSDASIANLNSRLEKPVTVNNFRPNIHLTGCKAFAEDNWYKVQIGDAVLRALNHCTRCTFITVNPQSGVKDPTGEPLVTLKKFRLTKEYKTNPCFGMYHALDKDGIIKVGDPIFAVDA